MKRFSAITLLSLLGAASLVAGGFGLNEVSARGNAMQGALVGSTRDVSAVYFNPANLTELGKGVHTMVGVTLARPDYDVEIHGCKTDQDEKVYPLPHLFLERDLSDDLYVGFGTYVEYGLGTRYEGGRTWPLAAGSMRTEMTSFTLSPVLAYRATDGLSLAAGFRALYMRLKYDRLVPDYSSVMKLDVDDWAYSFMASAAYQVSETVRVGLVYRDLAKFMHTGDIEMDGAGFTDGVHGDLTMPRSVMLGANWQATERLNLGLNATWNQWSTVDDLPLLFDTLPAQRLPMKWKNAWRISAGAEYMLADGWTLYGGYTHDLDPTVAECASTICPAGDRDQVGLGLGYGRGRWRVDVDYMHVFIHETDRFVHGVDAQFRNLRTDTLGLSYSQRF